MSGTDQKTDAPAGLDGLARAASANAEKGLPPVHLWNPEYCGEIDMRIARDGLWFYQGTPIGRERLVRLFSTILRKEDDGSYVLVTPVERVGIEVEDVPFVAVDVEAKGEGRAQTLTFRTNVGDFVTADAEHPIRIEKDTETGEPTPYVLVRARLEARVNRAMFYYLVDYGTVEEKDGARLFGVWSGGVFFPFAPARELGL